MKINSDDTKINVKFIPIEKETAPEAETEYDCCSGGIQEEEYCSDDCDYDCDNKQFIIPDEDFAESEMLIAEGCRYSLDDVRTRLNNNVLIVGGSGTGKTSTVVKPNLKQAVGSYIVSDPKGSLYRTYKDYLEERGYDVYLLDFTHPEKSSHYNPLLYIRTTQDIMRIVSVIINSDNKKESKADPFWDANAAILLSAVIGYMVETNYKPFNFSGILRLVRDGERGDDETKDSRLSHRFKMLKMRRPDSWACARFEDANQASTKTFDCIRATLTSKFSYFDTEELQEMMSGNDFTFTSIGNVRTAVFVTVSDTDRSMDALANVFFTQAMHSLCGYADIFENNRLPVPVRFILDDFATNCRIDEFPRMISTIRSRGISVMLMIQSEAQLAQGYGFDSNTIIANCDTYAYFGGNDYATAETISLRCNKPVQKILYMPVGNCWVFRRGSQPVYTKMFDPREYSLEKTG